MLRVLAALLLAVGLPIKASASTTATLASLTVTDRFIIPRYRALVHAAEEQARAWQACTLSRDAERVLRSAYQVVADRWAEIGFVRTGPMSANFRAERFNYWPETRNATSTQLNALLAGGDNLLTVASFVHDFIPAQGLPAIERLLYDDAYATNPRRCAVGQAIARNLVGIANDVLREWTAPNGVRAAIHADKSWGDDRLAGAQQATNALLTDLVGLFTALRDQKLGLPMGGSLETAKPRLAEAWRSNRSTRNVRLAVAAARAMERLFVQQIRPDARSSLESTFAAAERAATALPGQLGPATQNARERVLIEFAAAAFRSAQSVVLNVLAPALGASVGFNALDGD